MYRSWTDGALGDGDLEVVAAAAVQVLALAVDAVAGPAVRVVAEREQRGDVVVGDQPHVAALAAVAAVRAALGDRALAPERDAAGAAVAAAHVELRTRRRTGTSAPTYRRRYATLVGMATSEAGSPVVLEVDDRSVRLTNPDRVYFPATRRDQARSRPLLPRRRRRHRAGAPRPTVHAASLPHRGHRREGAPEAPAPGCAEWVQTVRVHFPRWNRTADELCVPRPADVVWAVQMSTVELHPWNSRRFDVERPDEWRIDLDPMPDATYADVRRVAHVAGEVLDELGRGRLAEDVRRQGHPHLRAHPAGARVLRGCGWPRWRSPARSSAGAGDVTDRRGGARTATRRRCSSTTTRTPAITRSAAPTRCAACRRRRFDADPLGRDRRRRAGRLHDRHRPATLRRARRPARRHRRRRLRRSTSCSSRRRGMLGTARAALPEPEPEPDG